MFFNINNKHINMDKVTYFYWTEKLNCSPSEPSIIFHFDNDTQYVVKASKDDYEEFMYHFRRRFL